MSLAPKLGIRVKSVLDFPKVELNGFVFTGTWMKSTETNGDHELIGQSWQCKKCGIVQDQPYNHNHRNF